MQGQFTSGTSSVSQMASITALKAKPDVSFEMRDVFKKRRDLVIGLLKDVPGIITNVPDGAFYVFPDVSSYFGKSYNNYHIKNSFDFSIYMLEEGNVALVSGEAFGDNNCVRFSYATSEDKLIEAIKRIKDALAKLK